MSKGRARAAQARMRRTESYFRDRDGDRTPTTDVSRTFGCEVRVGGELRKVTIQVGRYYVVAPTNPASRKHRGRPCQILELDDSFMPRRAAVRFTDSRGRWAIVDSGDLAESGTAAGPVAEPQAWSLPQVEKKATLLCARLKKMATSARIAEARTLMGKLALLLKDATPAVAGRCGELRGAVLVAMVEGIAAAGGRPVEEVADQIQTEFLKRVAH